MNHDEFRRKLLRGSLAAPAVLTVASPSGFAAGSVGVCITRTPQPGAEEVFAPTADQWLRKEVPVYLGKLKETEEEGSYYLSEYDQLFYPIDAAVGCAAGRPATDFTGNRCQLTDTTTWGLVYLDADGNTIGFGCQSNGGYAVTGSCWASVAPTA